MKAELKARVRGTKITLKINRNKLDNEYLLANIHTQWALGFGEFMTHFGVVNENPKIISIKTK